MGAKATVTTGVKLYKPYLNILIKKILLAIHKEK